MLSRFTSSLGCLVSRAGGLSAVATASSNCAGITYSTTTAQPGTNGGSANQQGMINKLLYRSKQRGFLELDLLMGLWAESNIPKMSLEELRHMSQVLDEENPDLFKWLTGQLEPPERLMKNPVFVALFKHVSQQLDESAPPKTRAAAGRDWVRGWDDSWRNSGQSPPSQSGKTNA